MEFLKTYSQLLELKTFEERLNYLLLNKSVLFGPARYLNQKFYASLEWRNVRNEVFLRDGGCDLGIPGLEITGRAICHHINPVTIKDLENPSLMLLNPEGLITVSYQTHQMIHHGFIKIEGAYLPRVPDDTTLWSRKWY